MSRFRYRAATAEGRVVDGTLDAPTRDGALDALRRQSLVPLDVAESVTTAGAASLGARLRLGGAARDTAVALAVRTLAALLGAGLPLDRALGFAAEQAAHPAVGDALRDARRAVQGGAGLAAALRDGARVFPAVAVAMLGAGEASGALAEAAERLADHLDEAAELRAQVRAALLYPALMAVAAGVGVTVLLVVVVPRFAGMVRDAGGSLPWSTRALVAVGDAAAAWWWLALALVGVGIVAGQRWLADAANRARWDAARLRVPVLGDLERRWATARFARTLGLLLRGGARLVPALRIAATASPNRAFVAGVERAATEVAEGRPASAALADTLPPLATRLLAVGEESGRLAELALRAADVYEGEVRRALRTAVALLEPAMILVFGAVVGFVALALLQAIYGINVNAL